MVFSDDSFSKSYHNNQEVILTLITCIFSKFREGRGTIAESIPVFESIQLAVVVARRGV